MHHTLSPPHKRPEDERQSQKEGRMSELWIQGVTFLSLLIGTGNRGGTGKRNAWQRCDWHLTGLGSAQLWFAG